MTVTNLSQLAEITFPAEPRQFLASDKEIENIFILLTSKKVKYGTKEQNDLF